MTPEPTMFALYKTENPDVVMLRNDVGEQFHVSNDAAGDLAIMLVDCEKDASKAEFVADEWRGRAYSIEEFGPDDDDY